jgi:hypothetical protein
MNSATYFNPDSTLKAIDMIYGDTENCVDDTDRECGIRPTMIDEAGNPRFCPHCNFMLSNTEKVNRKCYSCESKF